MDYEAKKKALWTLSRVCLFLRSLSLSVSLVVVVLVVRSFLYSIVKCLK
jgi:hypothetical protein